jgi:uncharacterized membrane protein
MFQFQFAIALPQQEYNPFFQLLINFISFLLFLFWIYNYCSSEFQNIGKKNHWLCVFDIVFLLHIDLISFSSNQYSKTKKILASHICCFPKSLIFLLF